MTRPRVPDERTGDAAGSGSETVADVLSEGAWLAGSAVRRFRLVVVEGKSADPTWESVSDLCSIGSHPSNDLVLEDPTVSRFHCEVRIDTMGARIRDLGSRNGTLLDGVVVVEARPRDGSLLRLGRTALRLEVGQEKNRLPVSERTEFGSLVGRSIAMRTVFAFLERASTTDVTVLLEGETGTGKEGAARAIHEAGARCDGPFVVVDCSAIPSDLLESVIFGHERGAFTDATDRRIGAFESADGGTIFLDEIGELPPDLQPKLLRVLENREIQRVGSNKRIPTDVRVVAATNRDLRAGVNAGTFRSDLYYRLAVFKIPLPPLRSRPEDIPILVDRLLERLGAEEEVSKPLRAQEFLARLARAAWPGNVRELRNYLERCLVLREPLPVGEVSATEVPRPADASMPYDEARRQALAEFERAYVEALLRRHDGRVSEAARAAGMDRRYLYRLLRRHGLRNE